MFVQKTSLMWSGGKTLRVITLLDVNLHKVIRFFAHWVSFFKKKAQFVSADAFSEKYLGKYYAPIEFLYHDSNEHFESKVSKYISQSGVVWDFQYLGTKELRIAMWTLLGDNNFCCYLKVDRNMEANTKYSTVGCSQRVTSSNIHFQLAGNVHRFVTVPQSILSINIFPTSCPILMTFFAQIEATIHSM